MNKWKNQNMNNTMNSMNNELQSLLDWRSLTVWQVPTPVILRNFTAYYELHYSIHVENNDGPIKNFLHLIHEKKFFRYTSEVLNVLAHLDNIAYDVEDITTTAAEFLLNVKSYRQKVVWSEDNAKESYTSEKYIMQLSASRLILFLDLPIRLLLIVSPCDHTT